MEVLLFGITREIAGRDRIFIPEEAGVREVGDLRMWLGKMYPKLGGLSSLAVAVDGEYAGDGVALDNSSEIALIPPVSGG